MTAAAAVAVALVAGACDSSAAGPQLVDDAKPQDASRMVRDMAGAPDDSPAAVSSSSAAAVRQDVTVDAEPWTVTHAANPAGSFSLVRNTSEPARGGHLLASITGGDDSVLAPRATTDEGTRGDYETVQFVDAAAVAASIPVTR